MNIAMPGSAVSFADVPVGTIFRAQIDESCHYCLKVNWLDGGDPNGFFITLTPMATEVNGKPEIVNARAISMPTVLAMPNATIKPDEDSIVFGHSSAVSGNIIIAGDDTYLVFKLGHFENERGYANLLTGEIPVNSPHGRMVGFSRWSIVRPEVHKVETLTVYPPSP